MPSGVPSDIHLGRGLPGRIGGLDISQPQVILLPEDRPELRGLAAQRQSPSDIVSHAGEPGD